jgi:hypothetical protein
VVVSKALAIPNRFYPVDQRLSSNHFKPDNSQTALARVHRRRVSILEAEAVIVDFPVPGWNGIVELLDDNPFFPAVIDQDPSLDKTDPPSLRLRQKTILAYQECSVSGPLAPSRGGQLNLIA